MSGFISVGVVVASCLVTLSSSYSFYRSVLPNGNNVLHPCKPGEVWSAVGHENPAGGGTRNSFGLDFRAAGYRWTQELCQMDSDGDGKTNGQELGDPTCAWTPAGAPPSRTENITHPGVCDPIDLPRCQGRTDFLECSQNEFQKCARIQDSEVRNIAVVFPVTQVPPTETNYFCMTFDLPSDQDYHMVASEPIISNSDVMHHMLLFGCRDDNTHEISGPRECDMSGSDGDVCTDVIAIWSVGIPGTCLPDNLGFRFGASSYKKVLLQLHWNNPGLQAGLIDSSGLRLYYRPAVLGVSDLFTFWIGQNILDIPPGQTNVTFTGTCPSTCSSQIFTKTAYITNVYNHMHYMGRHSRAELYRFGRKIQDLGVDEAYSYDSPVNHVVSPPAEVRPGDELRVTCSYSSMTSNRHVYFGSGTADEMCFSILTMYPTDAVKSRECVQLGELSQCQFDNLEPYAGCDWAALANSASQPAKDLEKNCNLNGFCRPECLKVVEKLSRHPCLVPGQQMTTFVYWYLQFSPEGVRFLGHFHSCSARVGKPWISDSRHCSKDQCQC
ncbi:hypothetical protein RRG08_042048 [Elysia crispata]|uniref:Uncharacterized protein n=1 Tax=Elysia crispata TaxID=231223 RepID=A0AAE0Z8I1_9GAST|nr:hypothetical protein RRG08_042048 [Elysia crispata]